MLENKVPSKRLPGETVGSFYFQELKKPTTNMGRIYIVETATAVKGVK